MDSFDLAKKGLERGKGGPKDGHRGPGSGRLGLSDSDHPELRKLQSFRRLAH